MGFTYIWAYEVAYTSDGNIAGHNNIATNSLVKISGENQMSVVCSGPSHNLHTSRDTSLDH